MGRYTDWIGSGLTAITTAIDGTERIIVDKNGLPQRATLLDAIRYALANGFGSTDLNIMNRIYIKAATKTLTESVATGVFDIMMALNSTASGTLIYSIQANDATDFQSLRGRIEWAAVNKAGTLTADLSPAVQVNLCSASTLTASVSWVAGTGKITLSINATSGLTQTVLRAKVKLEHDGNATITAL